jgi:hypothetical protein
MSVTMWTVLKIYIVWNIVGPLVRGALAEFAESVIRWVENYREGK